MTTTTESDAALSSDRQPTDGEEPATGPIAVPPEGRGLRLLRGRPEDPRWVRPALLGLLTVTALTYLWDLGATRWANSFYAAAVQAGTQSWKAWLFGALDAPATITVDKPPAAMWVMVLSGRIFGFNPWSMLVPQALMGVASVGLVYLTVRRWSGPRTALAAGALLAAMPAAVLMFRFNNPDALLVLCMVVAAYATTRAVDAAGRRTGTWWLVGAGVAVGFGFLTKRLQVMLVVPALGLAYLVAAPTRLWRRIGDLAAALAAIVVSAGWYVLLVELWPASSRPYIGGSTDNSLLQLALGYNGLSRILGGEGQGPGGGARGAGGFPGGAPGGAGMPPGGTGGMPGGGGSGGFGGQAGLTRLFTSEFAGNASWLLPAALVLLLAGLWWTRRAPRTDRTRALLILGGGWTLVHALVFSYMSGIIHSYYTVALVPGIAITVATGASVLWRHRSELAARVALAVVVAGTGVWSAVVLTGQQWAPALGWVLAGVAVVGAAALLVSPTSWRRVRALGVATVLVAVVGALGTSTAFAAVTAVTPHQGPVVSAGPNGTGFGGAGGGPGGPGGAGGPGAPGGQAMAERMRGFTTGENASPALTALLQQAGTRWSAATTGAMSAAPLQLASNTPVMAIGGFMGSDPAPTLAQFQQDVADGQIRYFIEGGPGGMDRAGAGGADPAGQPSGASPRGGPFNAGTGAEITQWVTTHFTAIQVDGTTIYDLARPTS